MSHMGQGPPKSLKGYISDLFEKSVPNMVTYLCKVLSKLHFPEGDTYQPPPDLIGLIKTQTTLAKKNQGLFTGP